MVRSLLSGVLCAAAILAAVPAFAQEDDGTDAFTETVDGSAADTIVPPADTALIPPPPQDLEPPAQRRRRGDASERLGLGNGPVQLFGTLETGLAYSTNPALRPTDAESDVAIRIAPSLRLETDWSRHDARLEASGEVLEYFDQTTSSVRTARVQGDVRIDIRSTTFTDFSAGYDLDEDRDSDDDDSLQRATEPRQTETLTAAAALTHDFGQLSARAGLRLTRFVARDVSLADGTTENNDDRNYISPDVELRLALRPQSPVSPFLTIGADQRYFDETIDRFGDRRDSTGIRATAGVAFNDAPIWDGSIAATYLFRDFEDADLESASAFGVTGNLAWRPSDFATLAFNTGVELDESREQAQSATRRWTAGLSASYSVSDSLELSARSAIALIDGAGPDDIETQVGASAIWQFNPFVSFALQGESLWFNGGGQDDDYDEQRLIASVILQR